MSVRKKSITLDDLYKEYNKLHSEYLECDKKKFKEAAIYIFNSIVDEIFEGKEYKLPQGLGTLYLDSFLLKGPKIDFGTSKKINKKVYYTNLHSDGKTYKVKWRKASSRFRNKKLYKFRLTRKHSRRLSQLIKEDKIKVFKRYV